MKPAESESNASSVFMGFCRHTHPHTHTHTHTHTHVQNINTMFTNNKALMSLNVIYKLSTRGHLRPALGLQCGNVTESMCHGRKSTDTPTTFLTLGLRNTVFLKTSLETFKQCHYITN